MKIEDFNFPFEMDFEGIKRGYYTDQYFNNTKHILRTLAKEGYRYGGKYPRLRDRIVDVKKIDIGNMEVDMQIFTKRKPFSVVAGIPTVSRMLKECAGYFQGETFVNTYKNLRIQSVPEGSKTKPGDTVMRIQGKYSDFAIFETLLLGILTRAGRIATNAYRLYEASNGRPVLYFPARFDYMEAQRIDGYAYDLATRVYNKEHKTKLLSYVSTPAQAEWIHQKSVGTIPHGYVVGMLKDTAEAMMQFARIMPLPMKRIALVDTNNDCVMDSLRTAEAFFMKYKELVEQGDEQEAEKYVLFAVRPDTDAKMKDRCIVPTGVRKKDYGVNARLIRNLRKALDSGWKDLKLHAPWKKKAEKYYRNIKIVATGGFTAERIRDFTRRNVPVDIYGVGSYFFSGENNDYTADVVRVKVGRKWYEMGKKGRKTKENSLLKPTN